MAANDSAFRGRSSTAVSRLLRSDENYWLWTTIHVLAAMPSPMDKNNFEGTRRVIDISGDGPNTLGMSLRGFLRRDITINALVPERLEMPELPDYFRNEVIGGPGAFMVEAKNHASFATAILKKDDE